MYHKADLDGILSGVIANYYIKERSNPGDVVDLFPTDYGDKEIKEADYKKYDKIYVIDFSDDWLSNSEHRNKIILIDHHKTCIEKNYPVNQFCEEGVAACRLTLQFFTNLNYAFLSLSTYKDRYAQEPFFVTMAGEYDIWDDQSRYSRLMNFGVSGSLSFKYVDYIFRETKSILTKPIPGNLNEKEREEYIRSHDSHIILNNQLFSRICEQGEGVLSYIQKTEISIKGVPIKLFGLNGRAFNTHIRSSLIYNLKPEEDFIMVWNYDGGSNVKVSLYSDKKDLHEIAKTFGGGGHKRACGFKLSIHEISMILGGVDINPINL